MIQYNTKPNKIFLITGEWVHSDSESRLVMQKAAIVKELYIAGEKITNDRLAIKHINTKKIANSNKYANVAIDLSECDFVHDYIKNAMHDYDALRQEVAQLTTRINISKDKTRRLNKRCEDYVDEINELKKFKEMNWFQRLIYDIKQYFNQ